MNSFSFRQETQQAFRELIQDPENITPVKQEPLALFDQLHTPTESIAMRMEAMEKLFLEKEEYNQLLDVQWHYFSELTAFGTEEDRQDYLDNEQEKLESLTYPEAAENLLIY
ncbi:hypothetical protein HCA69_15610 [Listeria grandensis]|uniref:Uncharacterized protein n=1 Tax=Listeria grandensis TaxID=1494963 RepID=A0A7X1CR77_9LIST|nr:hypothetical protein [Listeria grandensis]MBC1937796.1 hypothetical protein [Listeria grandensis]